MIFHITLLFSLENFLLHKMLTLENYFQNLSNDSKPKIAPVSEISGNSDTKIDMKEETYSSSQEDLKRGTNDAILKRIPLGAEATTVLVTFSLSITIVSLLS